MPTAYDLSTVIGGSGSTVSHNNLIPLGTDTHARTDMHAHYIHTRAHTHLKIPQTVRHPLWIAEVPTSMS